MAMTKTEQKKLRSYGTRATKIAKDSRKLAADVGKELARQMKKS